MNKVQGDLIQLALDGKFDVIVHGCNCQCEMGAGIAKTIKQIFPEAYQADCATSVADPSKMGSYTHVCVERAGQKIVIINAYTQFHWQGDGVLVDYVALRKCMQAIKMKFTGKRIAYPLIGAGLAGGDWSIISQIIDEELQGENHTLVEFKP